MSKRKLHKVRHYKPSPSFKECVKAGMAKAYAARVATDNKNELVVEEPIHHEHTEHCNH